MIFPGGSGSKEFNSLGQQAADLVHKFAYGDGKGLVGICAGGFLLSTTPGYPSMRIFPELAKAEYLLETEYTDAIPDLETAIKSEKSPDNREAYISNSILL